VTNVLDVSKTRKTLNRKQKQSAHERETVGLIKQAVGANIAAQLAHDERQRAKAARSPATAKPFEELLSWEEMSARGDALELEEIACDPIVPALREQLNALGGLLFRIGSTELMSDVLEQVAEANPRHYGLVTDIIDKAWDGVGNKDCFWAA
jgi:hypothetical protein